MPGTVKEKVPSMEGVPSEPSLVWEVRADFPEEAGPEPRPEGRVVKGRVGIRHLCLREQERAPSLFRESPAPPAASPRLQDANVLSSCCNLICQFF